MGSIAGTSYYNWADYVSNDYHDTTPQNNEIQQGAGYSVTAWMFSMMRDNHNLDWNLFYDILDNNIQTLDEADSLGPYNTDTFIIDVLGRASGLTFAEVQAIWRYDGPSGPGWGVRNWTDRNWYADLIPGLSFSDANPLPGDTIDLIATVGNNGDVSLIGVSVRFYEGINLLDEQMIDVPAQGNTVITSGFTAGEGMYTIYVKVNEDNIKIETDDTNNEDSDIITFAPCNCGVPFGDVNDDGAVNPVDVVYMVNYAYKALDGRIYPPPWNCEYEIGDVNCDNAVNPVDVVYYVNYAYKAQDAFCYPCAP